MSLAAVAKDFERLAKKARTAQKTRRQCIDAVLQELENAKAALDGMDTVSAAGRPNASESCDRMEEDRAASPGSAEIACGLSAEKMAGCGGSSHDASAAGGCEEVLQSLERAMASAVDSDSMASDDKEVASMSTKLCKVDSRSLGKLLQKIERRC